MQTDTGSHTALITAHARAYHAKNAECPLFHDPLAESLLAPGAYEFLSHNLAQLLPIYAPEMAESAPDEETALAEVMRVTGWTTLYRSRFAEDELAREVAENNVGQYVILGAGLDSFAFRRPESMAALRVFELDHPATQDLKRERIQELGWPWPENVHHLPVDLGSQRVADALGDSPLDPGTVTFVSWLGVTYYLPRPAVLATLRSLAGLLAPGSSIVFDYFDADALDPERASDRMRRLQNLVSQLGEPILTAFDPEDLARELGTVGLTLVEDLGPERIEERYLAGQAGEAASADHNHIVRATVA